MAEVRGYLANQLGFSEIGRYALDTLIKPRIRDIGITVLDPFEVCAKEIDFRHLATLARHEDVVRYWAEFNAKVEPINRGLMNKSNCMISILDGGHAVDDGVASEIGYYAGTESGPIFALRSDFRLGENPASTINAQILGYITKSQGKFIDGPNALERWFGEIKKWHDSLKVTL